MAEPKTKKNDADVDAFLDAVENEGRRQDAKEVRALMEESTGEPAVMWGPSIVGFGTRTQTYANGKTADWMAIGFSPRKANLVMYIMEGFDDHDEVLSQLGSHKTGKSCLYLKRLETVDRDVLRGMIASSYKHTQSAD